MNKIITNGISSWKVIRGLVLAEEFDAELKLLPSLGCIKDKLDCDFDFRA